MIGLVLAEKLQEFSYIRDRQQKSLHIVREHMPYGRVLIVDDVETNLYAAKGLMLPYGFTIETAISGFEAIDKVKGGASYDIVFMDHMMPEMDGIETVKKLRTSGYTAPIVALTANAITGNDVMFKDNGFDDFISKPIDTRQLDGILHKFIRKEHKGMSDVAIVTDVSDVMLKIDFEIEGVDVKAGVCNVGGNTDNYIKTLEFFCKDGEARLASIPESLEKSENKLFVTHVHAIKSAAANIGALRLSEMAKALESAGNGGDWQYVENKNGNFLSELKVIMQNISKFLLEKSISNTEESESCCLV